MVKNLDHIHPYKKGQISEACEYAKSFPFINKIIVFGSSVRDDCTEESDVDLCLDISISPDTLEYYQMSGKLKDIFDGICDVLIYNRISGRIKDEINTKGVTVYESEQKG